MESCMANCFEPPKQLQTLMSNELSKLQDRLSRCARGCQDNIQDQVSNTSSKDDITRLQDNIQDQVSNTSSKEDITRLQVNIQDQVSNSSSKEDITRLQVNIQDQVSNSSSK